MVNYFACDNKPIDDDEDEGVFPERIFPRDVFPEDVFPPDAFPRSIEDDED